jgi:hypothetical protein
MSLVGFFIVLTLLVTIVNLVLISLIYYKYYTANTPLKAVPVSVSSLTPKNIILSQPESDAVYTLSDDMGSPIDNTVITDADASQTYNSLLSYLGNQPDTITTTTEIIEERKEISRNILSSYNDSELNSVNGNTSTNTFLVDENGMWAVTLDNVTYTSELPEKVYNGTITLTNPFVNI